jgi:hypothetical protein
MLRDRGLDTVKSIKCVERKPTFREPADQQTYHTLAGMALALTTYYSGKAVQSQFFDYVMGFVILANCVTIGLEIDLAAEGKDLLPGIQELEHVFLTTYVVELILRVFGGWADCFKSAWFQLDLVLVLLGVMSIWVLAPLVEGGAVEVVDKVLVIRILRLVRLVRALRFLKFMQPLWKLVSGLLGSTRTVISAGFLLVGAMYVFACAGVALLAEDEYLLNDDVAGDIVRDNFASVPVLMLTLIQFTSCDSVASIYHPLVLAKPILILYFLPILLVIPISLMNLITAVIVDHAIQCSAHDAELERCRMKCELTHLIPVLNSMFIELDNANLGEINLSEIDPTTMSVPLPPEVLRVLKSHKLQDFLDLLDADGNGKIRQSEWVDGMCCLVLNEVPIENLQMLHLLNRQADDLKALKAALLPGRAGSVHSA